MAEPQSYKAAHAVLNTNELLCTIVGHLSFKDVVAVTGVCRAWDVALKADLSVRETLWLEPTEVRHVLSNGPRGFPPYAPLLCYKTTFTPGRYPNSIIGEVNPFLKAICGKVVGLCQGSWQPGFKGTGLKSRPILDYPARSWRDMFITQPPCMTVHVEISKWARDFHDVIELTCESGVKLGELHDLVLKYRTEDNMYSWCTIISHFVSIDMISPQLRHEMRGPELPSRLIAEEQAVDLIGSFHRALEHGF